MTSGFSTQRRIQGAGWLRKAFQRAYSLTELAIVLGVMGVVLASIWATASAAWEASRREQTLEIVTTIANNIHASNYPSLSFASGGVDYYVPLFFKQGIIPNSVQRRATSGCSNNSGLCADTPWGIGGANGSLQVCPWNYGTSTPPCATAASTGTVQFFAIQLSSLSQANCIQLASMISGAPTLTGLLQIYINSTIGTASTLKVSDAKTNCTKTDNTNVLGMVFRLNVSY